MLARDGGGSFRLNNPDDETQRKNWDDFLELINTRLESFAESQFRTV